MTVTFDQFLQMFPDDGFTARRGAHRAFSTPESIAHESTAAREFFDWWSDAGQPALKGASTPPTLSHPTTLPHPQPQPLAHPTAPRVPTATSQPTSLPQATDAADVVEHDGARNATAPHSRELVGAGAPIPSGVRDASAGSAEPKLTGWGRLKHELTRKR
ncbi:hypothetical protein QT381_06200 [Galbitalea sp. SE-J8]|uniref:hypothetical protein n=1 Tax=Galbitalea sp. SE-J8 TaxID=3054952 RepID=UPI00259D20D4|nr:hypothetical protein [Galbitalea sp. SE-J8]MDM4762593.1 hypothetical protein [Galbitalea sp. SE-J8]